MLVVTGLRTLWQKGESKAIQNKKVIGFSYIAELKKKSLKIINVLSTY